MNKNIMNSRRNEVHAPSFKSDSANLWAIYSGMKFESNLASFCLVVQYANREAIRLKATFGDRRVDELVDIIQKSPTIPESARNVFKTCGKLLQPDAKGAVDGSSPFIRGISMMQEAGTRLCAVDFDYPTDLIQ